MEPLYGHTKGLASAEAKALRALYNRRVPRERFLTPALARELTEISMRLHRRVGLLVDRGGYVTKVVVGEAHRVFLPDLGARRAGAKRFRGVRLVLSSLRPDGLSEDDLTDLALLQLDAVITVAVGADGLPGTVHYAHLLPPDDEAHRPPSSPLADGSLRARLPVPQVPAGGLPWRIERVDSVHDWEEDFASFIADLEGQFARSPHLRKIADKEPTILIGIALGNREEARRSLDELGRLADTAGLHVVDSALQSRRKLDGATCIGSGKLQELVVRSMHLGAEVLVFDRELSPSQLRNIAEKTELKVLDRTQLILDIFAQHATSREGKLQVELAQLRYRMPRLALMPTAMSRLTGGIGGRGPGETKLEINRRRAQERLTSLERQLRELGKHRARGRSRRKRTGIPVCAIVGYTNAGKSTLLNRLTNSNVLVEDKLFATLDPTSRRMRFPEEREILVTDTVGFIHDLPKTLVEAFKATLEELEEADLLLHVVDASDPMTERNLAAVHDVLASLDLAATPQILVWNKADRADPEQLRAHLDAAGSLAVSAIEGTGMEALLDRIERALFRSQRQQAASEPVPADAEAG